MIPTLGSQAYVLAADVLHRRAGLVAMPSRRETIERALEQTMNRIHVRDPEQFAVLLSQEGAVFDEVVHYITVGETYFFREPAQFEILRTTVFPGFLGEKADREIHVWSAACATGEEAYSLAIAARDAGINANVLGTDVDRTRLASARRGRYRQWSLRDLTPDEIDRHFARDGQDYCLRPELRRAVTFRQLNLVEDEYPAPPAGGGIDLIFCRNVLIYFSPAIIDQVCRDLIGALSPTGWLFVGASDPPVMNHTECDVVQTPAGLAYRKRSASRRGSISLSTWSSLPPMPAVSAQRPATSALESLPAHTPPAPVTPEPALPPAAVPATPAPPARVDAIGSAYAARDYDRVVELGSAARLARTATIADLAHTVRALGNLGRLDDAERFCTAALDRAPESSELHALHASLLLRAGQARAATVAARRALYLDRDFVMARISLGDASAQLGDRDAATRAYLSALRQLDALDPSAVVPGTDGESRERVASSVRDRLQPAVRAS